jgi:hypothetical protein
MLSYVELFGMSATLCQRDLHTHHHCRKGATFFVLPPSKPLICALSSLNCSAIEAPRLPAGESARGRALFSILVGLFWLLVGLFCIPVGERGRGRALAPAPPGSGDPILPPVSESLAAEDVFELDLTIFMVPNLPPPSLLLLLDFRIASTTCYRSKISASSQQDPIMFAPSARPLEGRSCLDNVKQYASPCSPWCFRGFKNWVVLPCC